MDITILLFDNFTALDVVGPYEVLAKLPGAKISFVSSQKGIYRDKSGLTLTADFELSEILTSDVLLLPGGFGIDALLKNEVLISWIRAIDQTSQWTVSVCSGALLLAEAGLLNNKRCTTHWQRKDQLCKYGVQVVEGSDRFVRDGKNITSAGVSAGIDMALYLASLVANEQTAKTIQLALEYDPHPPFDCGSPVKAPEEILARLRR